MDVTMANPIMWMFDENKFQGFHTICELNVIIYGFSLLLKTMGFYKVHIMNYILFYFLKF